MQLNERQRKAISTIKTLPQFEGWNDDEVAKNLSDVFFSNDPQRKSNAVSTLKSLSAFEGWEDAEIQNNLSDVFKNSPIYVDRVPAGEQGQKGYAQVIEMPVQESVATRLPSTREARRVKEYLQSQKFYHTPQPKIGETVIPQNRYAEDVGRERISSPEFGMGRRMQDIVEFGETAATIPLAPGTWSHRSRTDPGPAGAAASLAAAPRRPNLRTAMSHGRWQTSRHLPFTRAS